MRFSFSCLWLKKCNIVKLHAAANERAGLEWKWPLGRRKRRRREEDKFVPEVEGREEVEGGRNNNIAGSANMKGGTTVYVVAFSLLG